jgi:adenosylhomocysteine nucleosidase
MSGDALAANATVPFLICFAVKEEAKFFLPAAANGQAEVLITGMGQRNAGESLRQAFSRIRPEKVITAGFAGALNPGLRLGTVVFEADLETGLVERLTQAGAARGRFQCADRVVVTAAEKRSLRKATGADAVEMESSVIRALCREKGIPSATVRVISDAADEDLPLDFNALMTANYRINFVKLARTVALAPGKIPALMHFQKQTAAAARNLANVLQAALSPGPP